MTLVKFNNHMNRSNSNLLDSIFGDDFMKPFFADRPVAGHQPSVNILENDYSFELQLAAPGLNKEDFQLDLDKDLLKISVEKTTEEKNESEKFLRQEFSFMKFERSFRLPKTVNRDEIGARYENGVLSVVLPKLEEAKEKPARKIEIS